MFDISLSDSGRLPQTEALTKEGVNSVPAGACSSEIVVLSWLWLSRLTNSRTSGSANPGKNDEASHGSVGSASRKVQPGQQAQTQPMDSSILRAKREGQAGNTLVLIVFCLCFLIPCANRLAR